MSRKDFKLIAATIAALNFTPSNKLHIAKCFAGSLASTNSQFNRDKFIEAATA